MAYLDEMNQIWELVRDGFRKELSSTITDLFMGDLRVSGMEDNVLTMTTDSGFKARSVNAKYKAGIEKRFSEILGYEVTVRIECLQQPPSAEDTPLTVRPARTSPEPEKPTAPVTPSPAPSAAEPAPIPAFREPLTAVTGDKHIGSTLPPFNFEYTFSNFIVGNSNKFAHAACLAVADRPAQAYNPLFIYGPSGLGKTHLLYAITNELKRKNENIKVIYIKGDDFTNQMIDSLSRQAMQEFRDKYRSCDVLLIDDIQFIAGKTSTQEEFFHTFNALFEDSKQIILTSDRPPREIKTLEDRLKTRFEWGLIADIQPPDFELRTAIIKKKAEQVNVAIPDDVLAFLAENLRSNIRQIEGAIKKLGAMSFLSHSDITMDVARSCIVDLLGGAEPVTVTIDKIFAYVYKKYNIKREDLTSNRRTKDIASARHITIYLLRNITDLSYPSIAKIFDRDHSTIISSLDTVQKRKNSDPIFRAEMEEAVKELRGN